MTTQHTPGPWSVETDHHNNAPEYIRAYADGEMYDLASVLCDETGNAKTNARLIAAAPDLLNMLRNAENWFREYDVQNGPDSGAQLLLEDIRAAIAKATGAA